MNDPLARHRLSGGRLIPLTLLFWLGACWPVPAPAQTADTPPVYHLINTHNGQGYRPLVRDIGRSLYGIIVVRKDSPIREVRELDRKVLAFPAPNALGASLLPRAIFHDAYRITIKPGYVRTHSSVYLNVLLGQVVAGGGVEKTLSQQRQEIRNALRILYQTPEVAPHPVVTHPRVPRAVRERVRQAFLWLGGTPEGRALLAKVPIKRIGKAVQEDYAPLARMGLKRFWVEQ